MRSSWFFCFHWSYIKHHAILGYDLKIILTYQFAGFFTFDLFDLLILTRGFIPTLYLFSLFFGKKNNKKVSSKKKKKKK